MVKYELKTNHSLVEVKMEFNKNSLIAESQRARVKPQHRH